MHTLRNALPDAVIFLLILVCAYIADSVLHQIGKPEWGRYMAHIGIVFLLLSFLYSARKRNLITWGKPKSFLRLHEVLAWVGSLMILVHAGIHFNAVLPWIPMAGLVVVLASGVTGQYILKRALALLRSRRDELLQQGLSAEEVETRIFWDALVVKSMKKWRSAHFLFTYIFLFVSALHVGAILIFWNWP